MRGFVSLFVALALSGPAVAGPRHVIHDLTAGFWRFLDAASTRPDAADAAWRRLYFDPSRLILRDVECPALASGTLPPEQLGGWQRLAPRMRFASDKVRRNLPAGIALFAKTFPDLEWRGDIYVMVSGSCFDGRVQKIKGRTAMLIGIDVIAATGNENPTPLVLHEVFHLYHRQFFKPGSDTLWTALWGEGLATYAAKSLSPKATLQDLMLPADLVGAVTSDRVRLASDLLAQLSDIGGRAQTLYFRTDDRTERVPPRAGYYLGLLVAERLAARGNDLRAMAHWNAETAEPLVRQALTELATADTGTAAGRSEK